MREFSIMSYSVVRTGFEPARISYHGRVYQLRHLTIFANVKNRSNPLKNTNLLLTDILGSPVPF